MIASDCVNAHPSCLLILQAYEKTSNWYFDMQVIFPFLFLIEISLYIHKYIDIDIYR